MERRFQIETHARCSSSAVYGFMGSKSETMHANAIIPICLLFCWQVLKNLCLKNCVFKFHVVLKNSIYSVIFSVWLFFVLKILERIFSKLHQSFLEVHDIYIKDELHNGLLFPDQNERIVPILGPNKWLYFFSFWLFFKWKHIYGYLVEWGNIKELFHCA